jgi:hypothetical protein
MSWAVGLIRTFLGLDWRDHGGKWRVFGFSELRAHYAMLVTHSRFTKQDGRVHRDSSGEQGGQSVAYKNLCWDRPSLSY